MFAAARFVCGRSYSAYRPLREHIWGGAQSPETAKPLAGIRVHPYIVPLGKRYRLPQEIRGLGLIVLPGNLYRFRGEALSSGPGKNIVLLGKIYRLLRERIPSCRGKIIVLSRNYMVFCPAKARFYLVRKVNALYLFMLDVYCVSVENKRFIASARRSGVSLPERM